MKGNSLTGWNVCNACALVVLYKYVMTVAWARENKEMDGEFCKSWRILLNGRRSRICFTSTRSPVFYINVLHICSVYSDFMYSCTWPNENWHFLCSFYWKMEKSFPRSFFCLIDSKIWINVIFHFSSNNKCSLRDVGLWTSPPRDVVDARRSWIKYESSTEKHIRSSNVARALHDVGMASSAPAWCIKYGTTFMRHLWFSIDDTETVFITFRLIYL